LGRVAQSPGTLLVKKADIRDNHGRLHRVANAAVRERLREKYESALVLLGELS
jgi:hypothetical protein